VYGTAADLRARGLRTTAPLLAYPELAELMLRYHRVVSL
jgi:hypothetical protein